MKLKIIMRSMSLLIVITTIFIIVLYEPKFKDENMPESEASTNNTIQENYLPGDQEIIQGYSYDVLTIGFDEVMNRLTVDEKEVIKGILDKLSVVDCAKVNSILNDNGIDSRREALLYIRKRLLEEDYKRFEDILNQYIDLV